MGQTLDNLGDMDWASIDNIGSWESLADTPPNGMQAYQLVDEPTAELDEAAELRASLARLDRGGYAAANAVQEPRNLINAYREGLSKLTEFVSPPRVREALNVEEGIRNASRELRALLGDFELVK